jgi:hypothetical protein
MTIPSDASPSIVQTLARLPPTPAGEPGSVAAGSFCAEGRLALDTVVLEVKGVGQLGCPVSPEMAGSLQAAGRPARHGFREVTRLDKSVRDTGEIAADALTLRWSEGALPSLMAEIARGLGLPGLEAHLHNLLVYGPGQFFKPHQDTETSDRMIGTLVVVVRAAFAPHTSCNATRSCAGSSPCATPAFALPARRPSSRCCRCRSWPGRARPARRVARGRDLTIALGSRRVTSGFGPGRSRCPSSRR